MHAIVLYGPNNAKYETVPTPEPQPTEVLCRVRSISICGTDPGIFSGKFKGMWPPTYPFIIGHEWAGEVVGLGSGVTDYRIGDRVAAEAHKGCGFCRNCMVGRYTICENYGKSEKGHRHYGFTAQGGYAEFCAISTKSVHRLPDNISFEEGTQIDNAGVALYAVKKGRVNSGESVAVVGSGALGLLVMQCAKALGATTVIAVGRAGPRLDMAAKLGADAIVDVTKDDSAKRVKDLTGGKGVDVAIESAGTPEAIGYTFDVVKRGGRIVLAGLTGMAEIPIITDRIVLDDLDVSGIRANPNCCEEVILYVASGRVNVKPLITHILPLSDFSRAMEIVTKRIAGAIKVVLKP
jgi:L-iditol 2-dehydrogenase